MNRCGSTTTRLLWRGWWFVYLLPLLLVGERLPGQFDANMPTLMLGGYRLPSTNFYATPGSKLRAEPLRVGTSVAQGVKSPGFVGRVGGVAFDQVALPVEDLTVRDIKVDYRRDAKDGERLVITLNGDKHAIHDLPDWFIVPIARYADSPYYAIVTLFGKLKESRERPENYQYVVAYHPAFESTHLGSRLFQADFMLLDPAITGELPKVNGNYMMRNFEFLPSSAQWQPAAIQLNQLISGQQFQSYVICDEGVNVQFRLAKGKAGRRGLEVSGDPYFYFWRLSASGQNVEALPELSRRVSAQSDLLYQANPSVYQCLTLTLRYSALLRYCKRFDSRKPQNEQTWPKFMSAIDKVPHANYSAMTPVLVSKPNNGQPDAFQFRPPIPVRPDARKRNQ